MVRHAWKPWFAEYVGCYDWQRLPVRPLRLTLHLLLYVNGHVIC